MADLVTPSWDLGNVERIFLSKQSVDRVHFLDNLVLRDQTAPQVEQVSVQSENVLKVTFDDRYDPATVRDLIDYRLTSQTDASFANGANPTDVGVNFRFQRLSDTSLAPIVRFDVFLQFDTPLTSGHEYSLHVEGISDHADNTMAPQDVSLSYDDASMHNADVLHVNQVGYLTNQTKYGYVGGYTGDLGGQLWAVGQDGSGNGVIFASDGIASFSPVATPTTGPLRAIAALSESHAWAVGDGGTILHFDGSAWQSVSSPTTSNLTAIAFGPTGAGWIVGEDGVSLRLQNEQWVEVDTGITNTLRGVWLSTRLDFEIVGNIDSAWAVGDNGTVLRWNGTSWQAEASGTTSDLYALAGNHSQNLRAVGANGTVIRRFFGSWTSDIQTPANNVTLRSIITSASNETWVSGDNGTLWFANGFSANFTPLDSGTTDVPFILRKLAHRSQRISSRSTGAAWLESSFPQSLLGLPSHNAAHG
ncbi:MAG: hypothetical protein CMJ78_03540 [Planctomycetaceae bacterium]|nr:hypothetical protein [Planctomycetaceae bacterium]